MKFVVALLLSGILAGFAHAEPSCGVGQSVECAASTSDQAITTVEAWDHIKKGALVVDVRSPEEFASGHLDQAINIPHTQIRENLSKFGVDRNREIVLYCRSGRRAGLALQELVAHGYVRVVNAGGYSELAKAKPLDEAPVS